MLRNIPTAELMAEVHALAMRGKASSTQTADSRSSPDLNANLANFNNGNQRDDNHGNSGGKWKNKRDRKRGRAHPYFNGRNGKNNNNGNNDRRPSYDPNQYYTVHQRVGHNIFECRKAKREKLEDDGKGDGRQGNGSNDRSPQDRSQQS
jgi:hypothetical protein